MRIQQAKEIVKAIVKFNMDAKAEGADVGTLISPQLIGDPGLGKTAIPKQIAEELSEEMKEEVQFSAVILAQYDAGELGGMPMLAEDENGEPCYKRARPDWLPSEGKGVLLIDELSQAPLANLNIAAQLANEHRIGEHKLGEGWTLVFANNKMSNRAGTNALPTHLLDRLMGVDIEANIEDTLNHFNTINADPRVTSFLRAFPHRLAEFDAKQAACPSPRSWMRMNTLLSMIDDKLMSMASLNSCAGSTVGLGAANDFSTHLSLHAKMVDPMEVIRSPNTAELPEDVNVSYIAVAALAAISNVDNIKNILIYANRLVHQDHVAFLMKDAIMRSGGKKSELLRSPDVKKYLQTHGKELVL